MEEFNRWYDTVPQEADDNDNAPAKPYDAFLQEPGLAVLTDGEEDAPEEPPSDREDSVISSENEESGNDKRISPPWPPPLFACRGFGCTWPCAHHIHRRKKEDMAFRWYPELEHCGYQHPEMPRIQSEMKECEFCRVFFGIIRQIGCNCGANYDAQNDRIMKSGGCHCKFANCFFQPNGQLSRVCMRWTCGDALYELGLSTGKMVWSHSMTVLTNLF